MRKFPMLGSVSLAVGATFALNLPCLAAEISDYSGKGYELTGSRDKPLYTFQREGKVENGSKTVSMVFKSLDGKPLVVETAEFVGDAEQIKSYKLSQKQLGADGVVEVKDGKIHFTYTKDGKTKTSDEDAAENFVVGPSIVPYLQKHWGEITADKKIKVRFGVTDRLETVGFEYFKEKEEDLNGQKALVVKMKPSSFVIAALVDPLHFYFTPDGKKLLQVVGRTQVKREVGAKFKDLDAVTVYEYP